MRPHSSRGWIGSLVTVAVFLTATVVLALNSQFVFDTFNYYRYQPTESIAAFAAEAGMNDTGKFLFYSSSPSLEGRETFGDLCGRPESTAAILGCYDGQRIFIYNVTDSRLSGIRETTAAHEMLHAAYARLSDDERTRVDRLLDTEFKKLEGDKDLQDRMAFYERTEPGERHNELHSLIGSEIENISPGLEEYYERYFTDRKKVVALYQQYNSVFNELKARADSLEAQLNSLQARIKENSEVYNTGAAEIQRAVKAFNSKAENGGFGSQAEFSAERQRLVSKITALEALRSAIDNDIEVYHRLADELQAIATETNELNRSLDSSLAPPPSI